MTKPVIAVDIDEVLGEYAVEFVKFSNERWGTTLTVQDYSEHWSNMWEINHDETMERSQHVYASGFSGRLNQVIGANEALLQLKENFDIILVTSRPILIEQETRAWLEQNYSGIATDIYFAGMFDGGISDKSFLKTKGDIFAQINPVFVIDDQPKHCKAAADMGIQAILFGNYPWNQEHEDATLITRCTDWNEVLHHIALHS